MKKWLKLFISILAIFGFMELMPRILGKIQIYREIQKSSSEHGIDNNTIFYSEEPISYQAEHEIKEKIHAANRKDVLNK